MPTPRQAAPLILAAFALGVVPAHAQLSDVPAAVGKVGTVLDDVITGTKAKDVITGLDGNDRLSGGKGNDQLDGGSGKDDLKGGDGNDIVEGRSGNDKLDGGKGRDKLDGGSGHDKILARDGEKDEVFCGSGRDTVTVDERDLVSRTCEKLLKPKGAKIKRF